VLAADAPRAQCPPPSGTSLLAAGEIGLFFDADATQNCLNPPAPLSIVRLYAVTRVPDGGLAQMECPTVQLTSGTGFIVLSRTVPSIPGYEPLIVLDACATLRRQDPGSCPVAPGDLLVLSSIELLVVSAPNGVYCFRSACESIGGIVPRAPRYTRCDTGTEHEFTGGESMCIGLGTPPVAVQPAGWGGIKRLYVTR
jgi:hypothetical protein